MATQTNTRLITQAAAANLSANIYYFVKETAAQTVNLCSAVTDRAIGVLQNKPIAAGHAATVAIDGSSKVVAGAAIAAGALVAPMASGKAQTAVATQFPRGIALEAATADGDVIEILLLPQGAAI